MTYDPELHPNRVDRVRSYNAGFGWLLGLAALLLFGGFLIFSMSDNDNVATSDRPAATAPATTGSGTVAPAPKRETTGQPTPAQRTAPSTPPAAQ
jgi:hypothetical protein